MCQESGDIGLGLESKDIGVFLEDLPSFLNEARKCTCSLFFFCCLYCFRSAVFLIFFFFALSPLSPPFFLCCTISRYPIVISNYPDIFAMSSMVTRVFFCHFFLLPLYFLFSPFFFVTLLIFFVLLFFFFRSHKLH